MRWLSTRLWMYLVVYAALVCAFGGAYALIPNDFYYATSQFEPATEELRDRLETSLAQEIRRNIAPKAPGLPEIGPWRINDVSIWNLQHRDKWVVARAYMLGTASSLSPPQRFEATFDLNIGDAPGVNTPLYRRGRDATGKIVALANHPILYVRKAQVSDLVVHRDLGEGLPVSLSELFPCRSYPGSDPTCVEVIEQTDHDLSALMRLLSGRLGTGERDFLRMLYFSVVTITTVGFGDVVPLTTRARGLVTLEAFLGPVLLGFFLAAVGFRMSETTSRATEHLQRSLTEQRLPGTHTGLQPAVAAPKPGPPRPKPKR